MSGCSFAQLCEDVVAGQWSVSERTAEPVTEVAWSRPGRRVSGAQRGGRSPAQPLRPGGGVWGGVCPVTLPSEEPGATRPVLGSTDKAMFCGLSQSSRLPRDTCVCQVTLQSEDAFEILPTPLVRSRRGGLTGHLMDSAEARWASPTCGHLPHASTGQRGHVAG